MLKRGVRLRLRWILPIAQILIAFGLYRWSDVWFRARMATARGEPFMAPSPGFTLLVLLNAPIAFLRSFYTRHLPEVWDRALFIFAICLFWYWIALNIEQFPAKKTVTTFAIRPVRVLSDVLVMAVGSLVGLSAVSRAWWWIPRMAMPIPEWLWRLGALISLLGWCFILLFFFGRDLALCATRRKPRTVDAA